MAGGGVTPKSDVPNITADADTTGGNYSIEGYDQVVNTVYVRTGNRPEDLARASQVRCVPSSAAWRRSS